MNTLIVCVAILLIIVVFGLGLVFGVFMIISLIDKIQDAQDDEQRRDPDEDDDENFRFAIENFQTVPHQN